MPHEPLSTRRLLELMRDVQRHATRRHEGEQRIADELQSGIAAADAAHTQSLEAAESEYERRKQAVQSQADAEKQEIDSTYQDQRGGAQKEYHSLRRAAETERAKTSAAARQRQKDDALVILSTFDAEKGQPRRRLEEFIAKLKEQRQEIDAIDGDALTILHMRRLKPDDEAESIDIPFHDDSLKAPELGSDASVESAVALIADATATAREAAQSLYEHRLSRLLEGPTPFGVVLGAGAIVGGIAWLAIGLQPLAIVGGAVVGATGAAAALWFGVRKSAKGFASGAYRQVQVAAETARQGIEKAAEAAEERSRRQARELIERRDRDLAALGFELEQLVGDMQARTGEQLRTASDFFPARLSEIRAEHNQATTAIDERLRTELSEITSTRDRQVDEAYQALRAERAQLEAVRDEQFAAMREEWFAGIESESVALGAIRKQCDRRFPDWRQTAYETWGKPSEVSLGVEFGRVLLDLASVKSGLSDDPRLRPEVTQFEIPALVTLLEQPTLVISAEGGGRKRATELMQAVMLRWITGQPPGKVRFTVLDPVGLGEGFNSFMHLADYEEGLIATRIWSESRDMEEQLARLTQHMETVLQKYLRSEYETIHEYNAQAGEVAEPFQVLVINGFPHGFSDDTARRLMSLVTNGPRCGVYVMMGIDARQRLPTDFPLDDLLVDAVHLVWESAGSGQNAAARSEGRFAWQYPAFGRLPLALAEAPEPERMVALLKQVGQAAKDAVRVEVPFDVVAPEREQLWRSACDDELLVPVGRSGANRLQNVRLGKGTSQHLLVAGKTGSGKSTFLHALVTSAAMHYSPDELEFYLVDFKKGVEFKSYATNKLPHARVIAIESEREFGHSVLERLDEELRRRGELYRSAGVQNLADYRAAHPEERMPRVLLIIDEFQELFVEDDKLAQEATLLMDRLVRQGRAFGMHVVLGTQTLAGAFSIARSTLGQIAVRVALECSEADSHLILSDERNTAARFLSRPGEAIYNDQNGLLSANELFQVVWLPDRERTDRLAVIDQHRDSQNLPAQLPIVFEGNVAADPRDNEQLTTLINSGGDPTAKEEDGSPFRLPPSAFLGDAVAIKPPTAATFGRHGGSNLLIVGPDDRSALGMLSVGAVSLAMGDPSAQFVVLDASRPGDESQGVWQKVADAVPQGARLADPRTAPTAIAELAEEVARREAESDESAPPIYLLIYNAGRFRDLRRSEDDFSFSMDNDKPTSPDKHLAEILKAGPGVGVHAMVWCDSYNAASRLFDRMALREFALRVVLQISAADSSNLIDTPAASKLKPHRALFYSDETGETEKLRPYGPPTDEWLASLSSAAQVARQ